jgi:predicted nucleic acid-binding protein
MAGTPMFFKRINNNINLLMRKVQNYRIVLQQRNENEALQAAVTMQQGMVIDLDVDLALKAAKLSLQLKLPMADSIILATARAYEADLWTQDADFKGVAGVNYVHNTRLE